MYYRYWLCYDMLCIYLPRLLFCSRLLMLMLSVMMYADADADADAVAGAAADAVGDDADTVATGATDARCNQTHANWVACI